jgi:glycine/D-amino acid oxidase-like deaminating enzyme
MEHNNNGSAEPRSYWHVTAPPPTPEDALPDSADVVVVGGGMLGVWTTYWLAKAGANVALVERNAISWGATGRNGGFVIAGLAEGFTGGAERIGSEAAWNVWRLTEEGRQIVHDVLEAENIDCDYRLDGTIGLALSSDELTAMHNSAAMLRDHGVNVESLDRQALQELILTPLSDEILGGVYHRSNALLHSAKYLAGVAGAAKRHGAKLCLANVERLTPSADGVLVETSNGTIRAGKVVVGVNAWTDELVPALNNLVVPVRGQILSYAPIPKVFTTGIGASVTPTGEYWQQTLDGSIVLGGCRDDAPNDDVNVREPVPTDEVIAKIDAVFPRLFPKLEGLKVSNAWAGLMAFTSDYLPVADAAPDMPGVFVAGGFCGHGMPFGPRLGQLLAEATATGTVPDALHPLRINRPTLTPYVTAEEPARV